MSPRFGRPKGGSAADPTLGDTALAAACDALAKGRWEEARTLLRGTGGDWDRRSHRLTVLAEAAAGAAGAAWVEDWLLADPDDPDALALNACMLTVQTARMAADPGTRPAKVAVARGRAEQACALAAQAGPDDPTPWVERIVLASLAGSDYVYECFGQVRKRAPYHRDGHIAMLDALIALRPRTPGLEETIVDAYTFADRVAQLAPAGSPLAVLPAHAHVEQFRLFARQPDAGGLAQHWYSARAVWSLDHGLNHWWRSPARRPHPRELFDLNTLAYAAHRAVRRPEAAELFAAIGQHATDSPWDVTGRDPAEEFRYARARALSEPYP